MRVSRRSMARILAAAPIAVAAGLLAPRPEASPAPETPEETPLGRFLAKQEADLSGEEKRRVREQVAYLEKSLKEVRDFPLGNDVPPAGSFRVLKSKRPGRAR